MALPAFRSLESCLPANDLVPLMIRLPDSIPPGPANACPCSFYVSVYFCPLSFSPLVLVSSSTLQLSSYILVALSESPKCPTL